MSTFVLDCKSPPAFVHTPAIILQEESLFAALVPDLSAINKNKVISPDAQRVSWIPRNRFGVAVEEDKFTTPAALDLNVTNGIISKPILAYGYADADHSGQYSDINRFLHQKYSYKIKNIRQ